MSVCHVHQGSLLCKGEAAERLLATKSTRSHVLKSQAHSHKSWIYKTIWDSKTLWKCAWVELHWWDLYPAICPVLTLVMPRGFVVKLLVEGVCVCVYWVTKDPPRWPALRATTWCRQKTTRDNQLGLYCILHVTDDKLEVKRSMI